MKVPGLQNQLPQTKSPQAQEATTMLFKYLFQASKAPGTERRALKEEEESKAPEMLSSCVRQAAKPRAPGCFHASCLGHDERAITEHSVAATTATTATTATSARATRSNFAKCATSSLFPNSHFTNHECLPPLPDAFSSFAAAFPQYHETQEADNIRGREYAHLSDHVCLDYSGVGLFSHAQLNRTSPSSPPSPPAWRPPFFSISYKSASLKSELQHGEQNGVFEFAVRNKIMSFLRISGEDYGMVCTANRTAAFRLLAETYPFQSSKRLLTVYDYESEAVSAMVGSAHKRGAKVMPAGFSWPGLRIHSAKMKKLLGKRKNEKKPGLLVFPHMSRMTGVRYPYLWMKLARENGWHVALDACTLGPKDMDTLGITLIQPDFIICSFFKVFGENPSGFAGLFVKKSSHQVLETSILARSIGIVSIVQAGMLSQLTAEEMDTTSSFSGPMPGMTCNGSEHRDTVAEVNLFIPKQKRVENYEEGEASEPGGPPVTAEEDHEHEEDGTEKEDVLSSEIVEEQIELTGGGDEQTESPLDIDFKGLEHADSLGLLVIHSRLRCITNWLVIALMKLRHPHSGNGHSLVKIYGPRVKFDRGPAFAFNIFDWKGEKLNPALVQKLADRSNISLSCGFLHSLLFSEKYEEDKNAVLEKRVHEIKTAGNKKKETHNLGITVINASFGYMANFEDAYRLWAFVAKFLDADFVEKESWRYVALNQTMIEV